MLATSTTPGGQKMKTPSFEFVNAFLSLRNAVVTIGGNFDEGSKLAVVEDEAGMYGFTMRVRSNIYLPFISNSKIVSIRWSTSTR